MKKKFSEEDIKAWKNFTTSKLPVENKDYLIEKGDQRIKKIRKIDLHGFSLSEANKKIEELIYKYSEEKVEKIIVVTGKGLRSKTKSNPYISEKLNILKHSVPDFLNNNENLRKKIKGITSAEIQDGGEGAFYIFLKRSKV